MNCKATNRPMLYILVIVIFVYVLAMAQAISRIEQKIDSLLPTAEQPINNN